MNFLTDDEWRLHFSLGSEETHQIPLLPAIAPVHGRPDVVILFSGGADSLCAVIEAVENGRRPVLVSHRSSPVIGNRQGTLRQALRSRLPAWEFPRIGVPIHRTVSHDPAGYTQRTRAFLYAAIGASVASELEIRDVYLADNGIVSMNLPITEQAVGALASRGTHPKYLDLVNRLLRMVFPTPVIMSNPLWSKTRSEVLGALVRTGTEQLLELTNSCAHHRARPKDKPYCGVCSQCIDRRVGVLSAALESYDPADRYGTDIFTDALTSTEGRVLGESLVRFARRIQQLDAEQLFVEYPQLYDAIIPSDRNPGATAVALTELLHRQSETILGVLSTMIERNSKAIASGTLPRDCLISIASGGIDRAESTIAGALEPENLIRDEGDVWHLRFAGSTTRVESTLGLSYIRRLILHPWKSFSCLDLTHSPGSVAPPVDDDVIAHQSLRKFIDEAIRFVNQCEQDVLDAHARAAYRARLESLEAEVVAAQQRGDAAAELACLAEYATIEDVLKRASKRGGKSRTFTSERERARQSVRQTLVAAYRRIGKHHPSLADHLEKHIATGSRCEYRPDEPIVWCT